MTLISFATWEEGLIVAPGNPKAIRGIEDLARKDVTFVNRDPARPSATTLDAKLKIFGLKPSGRTAYGHLPAAWMVMQPEPLIAAWPREWRRRPSDYPSSLSGQLAMI